ncbi:MAG: hypothetical protein WDN48_18270 [Pseudolabrys sp.]
MLSAGALAQTKFVVNGLQVNEKKMRENLDITKGLIMSEAVMMGLGPTLGRNKAHDLVYDVCRLVVKTGRPLIDLADRGQGNRQARRPQDAGETGRAGELSRRRRRDGRSRAGGKEEVTKDRALYRPHGEERRTCDASRTTEPPHPSRRALRALLRMRRRKASSFE